jgi:hypothetical protein
VVLSASKELEPGARAMLVLAEGLFRLDVQITGDTLRTVVRNFSPGPLEMRRAHGGAPGRSIAFGEVAAYEPSQTKVEFVLGTGDDRVTVEVVIGTLRFAERGVLRVSAQALIRQAPNPSDRRT